MNQNLPRGHIHQLYSPLLINGKRLINQTDIPLRHPSERRRPQASEPLLTPPEVVEIDTKVEEDDPDGDFREEVFDTVMMTVPFTFLFILLHVYVPLLLLFIYLSTHPRCRALYTRMRC